MIYKNKAEHVWVRVAFYNNKKRGDYRSVYIFRNRERTTRSIHSGPIDLGRQREPLAEGHQNRNEVMQCEEVSGGSRVEFPRIPSYFCLKNMMSLTSLQALCNKIRSTGG